MSVSACVCLTGVPLYPSSPVAQSSTQQLNQSLAELVSWSNNVLLFGLTPGQTATEVVNGVRNAVTVSPPTGAGRGGGRGAGQGCATGCGMCHLTGCR